MSCKTELSKINLVLSWPYRIQLKEGYKPVQHPPRHVAVSLKPPYKAELERLTQLGVIKEVREHTEWINSILFRYCRNCKEDFDVNFSSTSESVRRLRRGNHFWDNLKGHCYECDIENSKLDRYTFFDWKNTGHNGPVFVKDTLYCVLKPRSLNYILAGHMTVHKVMKQIWQTFIRSQGKAKYKFLLFSTLHNLLLT